MKAALVSLAALLLLAGCGGPEPVSPLSLSIVASGAVTADKYDIRVFGSKLACEKVMASPTTFLTSKICDAGGVDSAEDCHVARAVVAAGGKTSRLTDIPPGRRYVFVIAQDANKASVGKGCAAADVVASEASAVTITIEPL